MESYKVGCEYWCMVSQNLREVHLQEVGLMQIPADHGSEIVVIG